MIFFFRFFSLISCHQCVSSLLWKNITYTDYRNGSFSNQRNVLSVESNREPIRILFDTELIESQSDSLICKEYGQKVEWTMGTYYCSDDDILTEKKIKVLKETLESLNSFLTRLLNVTRCTFNIKTQDMLDIKPPSKSVDKDLYICVVTRPFGSLSSTLASAFPHSLSFYDNRPIRGGIFINARYIPDEAQDENSIDRHFFTTLFHETCHVLGLTDSLYEKWLNRDNGNSYGSDLPLSTYSKDGKNFTILHTPILHEYAKHRWNRTYFADNIPMGLELEDGGGSGTAITHPEGRVYFNEVMVGLAIQPSVISDLVLSMLEDTGYYNVNWTMAEPLPWGSGESIGQDSLQDFPTEPPYLAFPSHYLCNPLSSQNSYSACSYDFSSTATCISTISAKCPSAAKDGMTFCSAQSFFNPLNFSVRGYYTVPDFIIYKQAQTFHFCKSNVSVGTSDETFGPESMCVISNIGNYESARCYNMICDETLETITIQVGNETKTCHHENETITFDSYTGYIKCPNPLLMCSMKKFKKTSVFVPSHKELKIVFLTKNIIIVTVLSVVVLILIIAIVFCIIGKIRHKRLMKEEQEMTDETTENVPLTAPLIPDIEE